ncbi:MAG: FAD-dependent oxidoreductase [Slackia sp.]
MRCMAIGAHGDKKVGMPGEDARGVVSAVRLLREVAQGRPYDWRGKKVCIVGGGNVAMDAARTAVRLGADRVTVVYRRRVADMTALAEEIEGAVADGCHIADLMAPLRIECNDEGGVASLVVQPQIIGAVKRGRPSPMPADCGETALSCDVVVVAIGQEIQADSFAKEGMACDRGSFLVERDLGVVSMPGVYAEAIA